MLIQRVVSTRSSKSQVILPVQLEASAQSGPLPEGTLPLVLLCWVRLLWVLLLPVRDRRRQGC